MRVDAEDHVELVDDGRAIAAAGDLDSPVVIIARVDVAAAADGSVA